MVKPRCQRGIRVAAQRNEKQFFKESTCVIRLFMAVFDTYLYTNLSVLVFIDFRLNFVFSIKKELTHRLIFS